MSSKNPPPESAQAGADRGNLIGALLRLSHEALMSDVLEALSSTEFRDLQRAHMSAMRPLWDAPLGMRTTELAAAARITKQSMSAVVEELEALGYVERVDDPSDGRAKLVRLRKRGREAGRLLRAAVRRVEADWARRVGTQRLAALRSTLADLVASLESERR
jgi:DNA-binding MarR family transcriptional regulator